jgi:hypothetical protein
VFLFINSLPHVCKSSEKQHIVLMGCRLQSSVSISIRSVHDNPDIFPEPEKFIPERWLESEDIDHWLVVFGKGSRSCIGLKYVFLLVPLFCASTSFPLFTPRDTIKTGSHCCILQCRVDGALSLSRQFLQSSGHELV